jgi:hypothetical protein
MNRIVHAFGRHHSLTVNTKIAILRSEINMQRELKLYMTQGDLGWHSVHQPQSAWAMILVTEAMEIITAEAATIATQGAHWWMANLGNALTGAHSRKNAHLNAAVLPSIQHNGVRLYRKSKQN